MKQFLLRAPSAIALGSFAFVDRFRKINAQAVNCKLDFMEGDFKYLCSPILVSPSSPISSTEFLPSCQGTCNTDDDCQRGMQCRTQQIEGDVPGCPGYPASTTGICYEATELQIVSCTSGSGDNLLLYNCQGHCETDLNCAIGLSCFQPGDLLEVPGCAGISEEGVSYCFNSSAYTTLATFQPSTVSSFAPSSFPTEILSLDQFESPSVISSKGPAAQPTRHPSSTANDLPGRIPNGNATAAGSPSRTPSNSSLPNASDDTLPVRDPAGTSSPSLSPSKAPISLPSATPNASPSSRPSGIPSNGPSSGPSMLPSDVPSSSPSTIPSESPSAAPSIEPTNTPSDNPSNFPSSKPTLSPSTAPSESPTKMPTATPSESPSTAPSNIPSNETPSKAPSASPTEDGVWNPNELPGYPHSPSSRARSDSPSAIPTEYGVWNPNEIPRDPGSDPLSSTSVTCASNPECAAVGLVGYCCPTTDNIYLDCCSSVSFPREVSDRPSDVPSTSPTKSLVGSETTPLSLSDRPSDTPSSVPSSNPSRVPSTHPASFVASSRPSSSPTELWAWDPHEGTGAQNANPSPSTGGLSDSPSSIPTKIGFHPNEITDLPWSLLSDRPSIVPSNTPTVTPSNTSSQPSDSPTEFGAWNPEEGTGSLNTPPSTMTGDISDSPSSTPTNKEVNPNDTKDLPGSLISDIPSMVPFSLPTEFGARGPEELDQTPRSDQPSDTPSSLPSGLPSRVSAKNDVHPHETLASDQPSSSPTEYGAWGPDEKPRHPSTFSDSPSSTPTKNDLSPNDATADVASDQPSHVPSNTPTEFGAWGPDELPGAPSLVASGIHSDAPSSVPSNPISVVKEPALTTLGSTVFPSAGPSPSSSDAPSSGPIMTPSTSSEEGVVDESELNIRNETSTSCSPSDPDREMRLAMEISSLLGLRNGTIAPVLKDPTRAEYHAFKWIVNLDTLVPCPDSSNLNQRFILALLYFETGGADWSICTESNNYDCEHGEPFMGAAHECTWAGIDCDSQREVTGIHLDKSNLVGKLPSELGDLDKLVELVMDDNNITGAIPTTLGKLEFLQVIDLDNNKLTGEIPLELYNASSLRVLDLDSNSLTGLISPLMGQQWPNLYFVQLDKNAFIGGIPSELATLPSLRYLSMFMNGFSEPIPLELCQRDDVTLYADCNICRTTDSCCTACLNQR